MKTDIISVSSSGARMETALEQAGKVATYQGLSQKGELHLRLLTEEMMGMMRSITGETEGLFWIEEEDGLYQLHLQVDTRLNSVKREELLAASSSGKNISARGFTGWLRDILDRQADEDVAAFTSPLYLPGMMEMEHSAPLMCEWEWSMERCENELAERIKEDDPVAREARDELEKSIVAKVADEIKVSIRGRKVELIVCKKLN